MIDVNYINIYGESIVDSGLVVREATDGYGLVTRGFLWQTPVVWLNETSVASPTTSWSVASSPTTTWTKTLDTTTTWTNDSTQKGFFGEG